MLFKLKMQCILLKLIARMFKEKLIFSLLQSSFPLPIINTNVNSLMYIPPHPFLCLYKQTYSSVQTYISGRGVYVVIGIKPYFTHYSAPCSSHLTIYCGHHYMSEGRDPVQYVLKSTFNISMRIRRHVREVRYTKALQVSIFHSKLFEARNCTW